jgi:hypothetical protein
VRDVLKINLIVAMQKENPTWVYVMSVTIIVNHKNVRVVVARAK